MQRQARNGPSLYCNWAQQLRVSHVMAQVSLTHTFIIPSLEPLTLSEGPPAPAAVQCKGVHVHTLTPFKYISQQISRWTRTADDDKSATHPAHVQAIN